MSFGDIKTDMMPATKNPNNRYGDMTVKVVQNSMPILVTNSIISAKTFQLFKGFQCCICCLADQL